MTPELALELFLEHEGTVSRRYNRFESETEVIVTLYGLYSGAAWHRRALSMTFTFTTALELALAARDAALGR